MKTLCKLISFLLTLICGLLFNTLYTLNQRLPNQCFIQPGEKVNLNQIIKMDERFPLTFSYSDIGQNGIFGTAYLFGCVPVKQLQLDYVEEPVVIPCGLPLGIQIGGDNTSTQKDNEEYALGMITFYDPNTSLFGAFGHAAGSSYETLGGPTYEAEIEAVLSSTPEQTGTLQGSLQPKQIGDFLRNDPTGVYGYINGEEINGTPVPIDLEKQAAVGPAILRTTVNGNTPVDYQIEIENVSPGPDKNLTIRITDPGLLAQTGGIVRGMSGSPILQNGRLVGALSQAVVGDPTRGYGIYAATMFQSAQYLF